MPSSPPTTTTRRRRILNAVSSIKPSNYYAAVPSSRSKRHSTGKPTFFQPVADPSDQYAIHVARDGSMITAVPIDKTNGPRSSPILFSDASAMAESSSTKTLRKHGWSRQGLLEARGRQRSKLKNRSDNTHTNSGLKKAIPFKPVNSKLSGQSHRGSKTKRQHLRWDLAQVDSDERRPVSGRNPLKIHKQLSDKRDDESVSSFPILSPTHKFDENEADNSRDIRFNKTIDVQNGNATSKPVDNTIAQPTNTNLQRKPSLPNITNSTHSFQNLLHQRMQEIQSEQSQLLQSISKKEMIERTLISAIDENLGKNRKKMEELNKELDEIKFHLNLKEQSHQSEMGNATAQLKSVDRNAMLSLTADPSLTMIESSFLSGEIKQATKLDPPARPSPIPLQRQDPKGPRISAVLCGNDVPEAYSFQYFDDQMPIRPLPKYLGLETMQQQRSHTANQQTSRQPNGTSASYTIKSSLLKTAHRKRLKKNVRFNLSPQDEGQESVELKFVNDSPSVNGFSLPLNMKNDAQNQNHSQMFQHFDGGTKIRRPPAENHRTDDQSWQGSQYDYETFDDVSGKLLPSQHYDFIRLRDNDHHVIKSEHYSTESHNNMCRVRSQPISAFKQYHRNGGASSDSVETDPDLGFIHAVAAIVIQTAVRRYLAEIRAMERLYAVQVIQTTICQWMVRQTDPNLRDYRVVRKRVSHMPSPVRVVPTKIKRVMFQHDQNANYHNEATNIQRCWRGWWAREGIEVDHYAASQIQRVFRGWWQREALEVDQYCAIEIQRVIRGYLGRMSYIYDLYCVIVAQSVIRRYLAFYESAIRLANVLYIQAIFRGYKVRSELMRYVKQGQEVAATMIQAQYRSYDAQMNFINSLADILIVQSVARRWLTLQKFKQVKLQYSYHHGVRRHKQVAYNIHNNSSVSRAIQNLQHYPVSRQHQGQLNSSSPRWQSSQSQRSPSRIPSNRPPRWNESSPRAEYPPPRQADHNPDGFETFNRGGSEEWYDGNKSEASEMLTNWKRRGSR